MTELNKLQYLFLFFQMSGVCSHLLNLSISIIGIGLSHNTSLTWIQEKHFQRYCLHCQQMTNCCEFRFHFLKVNIVLVHCHTLLTFVLSSGEILIFMVIVSPWIIHITLNTNWSILIIRSDLCGTIFTVCSHTSPFYVCLIRRPLHF